MHFACTVVFNDLSPPPRRLSLCSGSPCPLPLLQDSAATGKSDVIQHFHRESTFPTVLLPWTPCIIFFLCEPKYSKDKPHLLGDTTLSRNQIVLTTIQTDPSASNWCDLPVWSYFQQVRSGPVSMHGASFLTRTQSFVVMWYIWGASLGKSLHGVCDPKQG